ncbi:MAG TPA: hypothetical protein VEY30_04505 [Myxococcaceae bacterium]|nr:hypothetical protein [Myxococcaceae bacterium]
MIKRLTAVGNELALFIDRPVLEAWGIGPETPLELRVEQGRLIVKPVEVVSRSPEEERTSWLQTLLELKRPIHEITQALAKFPWRSDEDLVLLTASHLREVLRRYLTGQVASQELELWADLVECREDIGYEEEVAPELKRAIFEFANPSLQPDAQTQLAKNWMSQLESKGQRL